QMESKRLGLLHDLVPKADLVAVLLNPNNPFFENQLKDINEASHALGLKIHIETASNERDITAAFNAFGGNITGFTFVDFEMVGKWLAMLNDAVPNLSRAALMFNPALAPYFDVYLRSFEATPRSIKAVVTAAPVRDAAEIEAAVAKLARDPGGSLIAAPDPFVVVNRDLILRSVERHPVPAIYTYRQFVQEGGLMSYGPDTADIFRRSASYVDRILKGVKPADLPTQAPTKFELSVNLKTAKALGLTVPPTLLALADEVIE